MANDVAVFNPGPAKVPREVIREVQEALVNCNGSGLSIMEMSHRSADFAAINKSACEKLRKALDVPPNYKVLLMQAGGTGQFAAVPLNLMRGDNPTADYAVTGNWSMKAAKEAQKYLKANEVFPRLPHFTSIPDVSEWKLNPEASYLYYCDNETVHGVEYPYAFTPETGGVPLVCDVSSNFLSRKVDVSKYGLIYAGVQKNAGMAGVTVVIVREDLLGQAAKICPVVLDYTETDKMNSLYNTPCTTAVFVLERCLSWVLEKGGVAAMEQLNAAKSKRIYDLIDQSDGFYHCPVVPQYRSRMNVVFRVGGPEGSAELEAAFVRQAEERGLIGLKGHRSVGGQRASLFNSVTVGEVERLAEFMDNFQRAHK